jgi:hypothetical protein
MGPGRQRYRKTLPAFQGEFLFRSGGQGLRQLTGQKEEFLNEK